jgi:hypothetical protein
LRRITLRKCRTLYNLGGSDIVEYDGGATFVRDEERRR